MNDLFENSLADSLGKLAETAPLAPDADRILAALGRRKARRIGWAALTLTTCASALAVLLIFVYIFREAWPFFSRQSLSAMLGSVRWYPTAGEAEFGALALLAGSAYVTAGALLVAGPLGLLAAVFLSDIAPFGVRQVAKPLVEILAAIPSVAYGFFAVQVMAPWMQARWGLSTGANALNASLILGVMAIPTIVSISEDALSAVGRDLREGAYALGATRSEMILTVLIPAAHSGIIAAIILGIMRAIGETMVVWMASGNANQIPSPWWDLTQSVRTVTATIAAEMSETPKGSSHYHALFALGLILLAITFGLNLASERFLARAKRGEGGKR